MCCCFFFCIGACIKWVIRLFPLHNHLLLFLLNNFNHDVFPFLCIIINVEDISRFYREWRFLFLVFFGIRIWMEGVIKSFSGFIRFSVASCATSFSCGCDFGLRVGGRFTSLGCGILFRAWSTRIGRGI
jgi:hypothetical protein